MGPSQPGVCHAFRAWASFDVFYALGVALIGTRFANHELAAANTVFVVLHSMGGFGGSVLVGWAMDATGPVG